MSTSAVPAQVCWLAAVLQDEEGNVLIIRHRDSQAWDLPGGALGLGEDIHAGVRRVVAESVAIGISVGWMAGIYSHIRDGLTMVFLTKHVTGRITPRGDAQLCRWVTPANAARILWPRRADQLWGALTSQAPQPIVVVRLASSGAHRGLRADGAPAQAVPSMQPYDPRAVELLRSSDFWL